MGLRTMWLEVANCYAKMNSGCAKVSVGSVIVDGYGSLLATGANRTIPYNCKEQGCRRVELYGDDSKNHRLPEDCRAIHSEIDALCKCNADKINGDTTIYVTRYPCEACARAIVASGIKNVVYGRLQEISEETRLIFERNEVNVIWENSWVEEDVTR